MTILRARETQYFLYLYVRCTCGCRFGHRADRRVLVCYVCGRVADLGRVKTKEQAKRKVLADRRRRFRAARATVGVAAKAGNGHANGHGNGSGNGHGIGRTNDPTPFRTAPSRTATSRAHDRSAALVHAAPRLVRGFLLLERGGSPPRRATARLVSGHPRVQSNRAVPAPRAQGRERRRARRRRSRSGCARSCPTSGLSCGRGEACSRGRSPSWRSTASPASSFPARPST